MKLYKALIRLMVTYSTQASRTVDVKDIRVFENKFLRRICGPICIQGVWRLRANTELDTLLRHTDLDLLSLRGSVGLDTSSEWKKNGCPRRY
jgi:hypothetical protein